MEAVDGETSVEVGESSTLYAYSTWFRNLGSHANGVLSNQCSLWIQQKYIAGTHTDTTTR